MHSIVNSLLSAPSEIEQAPFDIQAPIPDVHHRHLLQLGETPIPNQVIEASQAYYYELDAQALFGTDATLIGVTETNSAQLPPWLSLQSVGSVYDTPGSTYDVKVQGDTAYLADGPGGFLILDMQSTGAPVLLGQFAMDDARQVVVREAIAYVADYTQGVYLLNISDPTQITPLGQYNQNYVNGLALAENTLWLAANGIYGVDISNPSQPTSQGSYTALTTASAITVEDTVAYVSAAFEGLYLLDISQPNNPTLLGNYTQVDMSHQVFIQGNTAYLADDTDLQILDVTDSAHPQKQGSFPIPGGARQVFVEDDRAYVAAGAAGVHVLDVSQPSHPTHLSTIAGRDTAQHVARYQNHLLMADGSAGLQSIDLSGGILQGIPTTSRYGEHVSLAVHGYDTNSLIGSQSFQLTIDLLPQRIDNSLSNQNLWPNQAVTQRLDSNALFLDPNKGFLPLSVSWLQGNAGPVPEWLRLGLKPTLSTGTYHTNPATSLAVEDGIVYLAVENTLHRINVRDALNPESLGTPLSTNGYITHLAIDNNKAYLTDNADGVVIIEDISGTPTPLPPAYAVNQPTCVVVNNNMAYVADNAGLHLLDISNSSAPNLLAKVTVGYTYWIDVQGTHAYLAAEEGLRIVDISNPAAPQPKGVYTPDFDVSFVVVSGDIAYIAAAFSLGEIHFVDISDANNPTQIGQYRAQGDEVAHMQVEANTLFLSLGDAGVEVVDVSDRQHPIQRAYYTELLSEVTGISVQGNTAYLAESNGLKRLDLSSWELGANPATSDVGNYNILLTATNHLGGKASELMTMRVEGAPVFQKTVPTQYAKVGWLYNYAIPLDLVTDPNFDPIYYSIEALDGDSIPVWLSFNAITANFAGSPQGVHTGRVRLKLTATDTIAGSSSTEFELSVDHMPLVNYAIPSQVVAFGQDYHYTVRADTFDDVDSDDSLSYRAQLSNAQPLPAWLGFDNTTLTFSGVPTEADEAVLNVLVIAMDTRAGVVSVPMEFLVEANSAPVVLHPIVGRSVGVGELFTFPVPEDMFYDRNGDMLTMSAGLLGDKPLPNWLSFDAEQQLFSGTPGHSNTNSYSDHSYNIELRASDGKAAATSVFTINVQGPSSFELFIKFALPILSGVGTAFGLYKKRAICLNRFRRDKYTREGENVAANQAYSRTLLQSPETIRKVQVKTLKPKGRACSCSCQFFRSAYQLLPGGGDLPPWLEYDSATNTLGTPPGRVIPSHAAGRYTVKVKGKGNILLEQFELVVSRAPALQQSTHSAGLFDASLPPPPPPEADAVELTGVRQGGSA